MQRPLFASHSIRWAIMAVHYTTESCLLRYIVCNNTLKIDNSLYIMSNWRFPSIIKYCICMVGFCVAVCKTILVCHSPSTNVWREGIGGDCALCSVCVVCFVAATKCGMEMLAQNILASKRWLCTIILWCAPQRRYVKRDQIIIANVLCVWCVWEKCASRWDDGILWTRCGGADVRKKLGEGGCLRMYICEETAATTLMIIRYDELMGMEY